MALLKSSEGLVENRLHLQNLNQIRVAGLTDRHAGRQYDYVAFSMYPVLMALRVADSNISSVVVTLSPLPG